MKDIYEGDLVSAWEDEEACLIFLSFPSATLNIPPETWSRIVADFKNLVIAVRKAEIADLEEKLGERQN